MHPVALSSMSQPNIPRPAVRSLPWRLQLVSRFRRFHRNVSGATAVEYMLIMALVVIPLAALTPMFIRMVKAYALRMSLMRLPFP